MAKKLELNFSSSKDAEIIRFIQLNKDANTSPIFISALEYYIKTGEFLNIGKVCTKTVIESNEKIRKPIYVPQNSVVEKWSDEQKEARRGLLSTIVRHVLKNSLTVVDTEAEENIEDTFECMLKVQALSKKPSEYALKSDSFNKQNQLIEKPTFEGVINFSEPKLVEQKKEPPQPPKKGKSIMDKLMPKFDED